MEALHGLLTADVAALPDGRAAFSLILTPKGRLIADTRVLHLANEVWLDIPRPAVDSLLEHFATYLPPRLARVSPIPELRRLTLAGPLAESALRTSARDLAARLEARPASLEIVEAGGPTSSSLALVRRDPAEGVGVDLYPAEAELQTVEEWLDAVAAKVGGRRVGSDAREVWRIEHGVPLFGVDMSGESLPQETGLVERAVSFEKGCYTGQEVVARIHFRGHVNRLLRGLRLPSAEPPLGTLPGAELYSAGRRAGRVTSVAVSPRFGAIGLGIIRREIEPGTALGLTPEGEADVAVVSLPFTTT